MELLIFYICVMCVDCSQIKEYFTNSYDLDELIFTAITGTPNSITVRIPSFNHCIADEENFVKCPDRLRLPLIFYLAHTASVYVNKLMLAGLMKVRDA